MFLFLILIIAFDTDYGSHYFKGCLEQHGYLKSDFGFPEGLIHWFEVDLICRFNNTKFKIYISIFN